MSAATWRIKKKTESIKANKTELHAHGRSDYLDVIRRTLFWSRARNFFKYCWPSFQDLNGPRFVAYQISTIEFAYHDFLRLHGGLEILGKLIQSIGDSEFNEKHLFSVYATLPKWICEEPRAWWRAWQEGLILVFNLHSSTMQLFGNFRASAIRSFGCFGVSHWNTVNTRRRLAGGSAQGRTPRVRSSSRPALQRFGSADCKA